MISGERAMQPMLHLSCPHECKAAYDNTVTTCVMQRLWQCVTWRNPSCSSAISKEIFTTKQNWQPNTTALRKTLNKVDKQRTGMAHSYYKIKTATNNTMWTQWPPGWHWPIYMHRPDRHCIMPLKPLTHRQPPHPPLLRPQTQADSHIPLHDNGPWEHYLQKECM